MSDYPEGWPACIMCGAKANEPCVVISGNPEAGEHPGDVRDVHHYYRAKPGEAGPAEPFVPVKDEPAFVEGARR